MNTTFIKERLENLDLKPSETKIIGVRPTKNAMELQLVFAEKIDRPSNRGALADFNSSDERFGSNNAQPVWMKAMLADVAKLLPEAVNACKQAIENQDYVTLDITNPTIAGQRLRVEITETHKPSKWELANLGLAAKQDGEGNYLHRNNFAIFVDSEIVKGAPKHRFIHHTGKTRDVYELDYSTSEIHPVEESKHDVEEAVFEQNINSNHRELV